MSRCPGIISHDPFSLRLPPLTPGVLGVNDAANPDLSARPGDTPGTLGVNDCGDPEFNRYHIAVHPLHLVTEAEQTEYELFVRKIKVHGKERLVPIITDHDVHEYLRHRNKFFGSAAAYASFADESDKELNETKGLRKLIELHGDAQTVFYRWVRKAYKKKLGDEADVPRLVRAGMNPALLQALRKVKLNYTKGFKAGGFNPRPMKLGGRYRLGTLSEHGLGNAADIDDRTNPQLTIAQWQFILKFVGKPSIDRSPSRWKRSPEELWKDVKAVNDLFVEKIKKETERIQKERSAAPPPSGATGKPRPDPIDVILAASPELKKWRAGFFNLEWPLVKELHANGFLWGATFSTNVDLHHFQL